MKGAIHPLVALKSNKIAIIKVWLNLRNDILWDISKLAVQKMTRDPSWTGCKK